MHVVIIISQGNTWLWSRTTGKQRCLWNYVTIMALFIPCIL